jgi:hypothetical protein
MTTPGPRLSSNQAVLSIHPLFVTAVSSPGYVCSELGIDRRSIEAADQPAFHQTPSLPQTALHPFPVTQPKKRIACNNHPEYPAHSHAFVELIIDVC